MCLALNSYMIAQEVIQPDMMSPEIDTAKANKVKAVYLYSLGRFTKWPNTSPSKAFTIGVVGESTIQVSLGKIARKRKIQERQIKIASFSDVSDLAIAECQIVFVSHSVSDADTISLMRRVRNTPTLTVTESSLRPPGAVVNLIVEGDGIEFEINSEEARRKKLAMDARLLRQGRKMLVGK